MLQEDKNQVNVTLEPIQKDYQMTLETKKSNNYAYFEADKVQKLQWPFYIYIYIYLSLFIIYISITLP